MLILFSLIIHDREYPLLKDLLGQETQGIIGWPTSCSNNSRYKEIIPYMEPKCAFLKLPNIAPSSPHCSHSTEAPYLEAIIMFQDFF